MSLTYILVGVALTMSILVLKVHHNGHHDNNMEVPLCLRHIFLEKLARLVGMRRYVTTGDAYQKAVTHCCSIFALLYHSIPNCIA